MNETSARRGARVILWTVSACYAYGAAVHAMSIAGLAGYDWTDAPLRWQVLDVAYLALDAVVVVALPRRRAVGYAAFFCAAISQIVLYTAMRGWVLGASAPLSGADASAQLDALVAFHMIAIAAVVLAIRLERPGRRGR